MKSQLIRLGVCLAIALSAGACKKSSGGGGGGGGGGNPPPTSWLVGPQGLMVNVTATSAQTYPLTSKANLNKIACRYAGEAWVAGSGGTLLYTSDGGANWQSQSVPTTAELRTVATQDAGPVVIGGDGVLMLSTDTGAHWTELSDGTRSFRAIAAAQEAATVLALSEDGALFSIEHDQLVPRGNFPAGRALAIAPDGQSAIIVGDQMVSLSSDGGVTWSPVATVAARLDDVRIDESGDALAVGSAGTVAHISASGAASLQQIGSADLHALHIKGESDDEAPGTIGSGFAAGDAGQVFVTYDGGATWIAGPSAGGTVTGLDQVGAGHL